MSAYGPLMISIKSEQLSPKEKKTLQNPSVGGVLLFKYNYKNAKQLAQLTDSVKEISEDLIIAVDQEGGRVQRFQGEGFLRLPPARLFGHCYDEDPKQAYRLACLAGFCSGKELAQYHIDCMFAPVLDIDSCNSSVIGDRAYHSQPEVISVLASAYLHGLHAAGLIGTGKHFPGHGWVREDTHDECASDDRPFSTIYHADIYPYKHLAEENILDAVMMSHVIYSALDSVPASQSQRWIMHVLRQQLDFQGIVFSDDLNMKGFSEHISTGTSKVEDVLKAGCDMLIVCNNSSLIKQSMQELAASPQLDLYKEQLKKRWQQRQKEMSASHNIFQGQAQKTECSQLQSELDALCERHST